MPRGTVMLCIYLFQISNYLTIYSSVAIEDLDTSRNTNDNKNQKNGSPKCTLFYFDFSKNSDGAANVGFLWIFEGFLFRQEFIEGMLVILPHPSNLSCPFILNFLRFIHFSSSFVHIFFILLFWTLPDFLLRPCFFPSLFFTLLFSLCVSFSLNFVFRSLSSVSRTLLSSFCSSIFNWAIPRSNCCSRGLGQRNEARHRAVRESGSREQRDWVGWALAQHTMRRIHSYICIHTNLYTCIYMYICTVSKSNSSSKQPSRAPRVVEGEKKERGSASVARSRGTLNIVVSIARHREAEGAIIESSFPPKSVATTNFQLSYAETSKF